MNNVQDTEMTIRDLLKSQEPRILFLKSLAPDAKVLDLGCGIGHNFTLLHSMHPQSIVYGIDIIPPEAVEPRMRYSRCDLEAGKLPFEDETFDAVLCTHLLEHLRDPLKLGHDINRVLKPGGKIYVEAPNWTTLFVPSISFQRKQHGPFNFFDDPTHLKPWSQHGLYVFITQSCLLNNLKTGIARVWWRIPLDLAIIVVSLLSKNRSHLLAAFVNIYGWCCYGIGVKTDDSSRSRTM